MRPHYITVAQAAIKMEVSRGTVYNLIRSGQLRAVRFGVVKGIRCREEDVAAFLAKREKEGETVYMDQYQEEDEAPFVEIGT